MKKISPSLKEKKAIAAVSSTSHPAHSRLRRRANCPFRSREAGAGPKTGSLRKPGETLDTIFGGKLTVLQGKEGYRFSIDAVLLAHFVGAHGREKIADLGTGNGIIPLMLATLYPSVDVVGMEIQEKMVDRALRSVSMNKLEGRVTVVLGDVCAIERIFPSKGFDLVVCNPPYRGPRSGRISIDPEKRIARHEIGVSLRDFIRAGSYLLRSRGKMALIYPATRMVDLLRTMSEGDIEPKRLRTIHSFKGAEAKLVLVEGVKGGGTEVKILPPLVVYQRGKEYTQEVENMLGGGRREFR